jgi:hypothetical protein
MHFDTWEPVYEAVLADFGFDRGADERARDDLARIWAGRVRYDPDRLDAAGRTVAVAGAAPRLEDDRDLAAGADLVFAASGAAGRLLDAGVGVDCVVTDLDKDPDRALEISRTGTPVVGHAHGDNRDLVEAYGPRFAEGAFVPTTQAAPVGPVRNFGGFTDGDRAAFLADHLGADRLVFPGWAFDDPTVGAMKARKLEWAERLLRWLELRRGQRFSLLDGRRDGIDTDGLPR